MEFFGSSWKLANYLKKYFENKTRKRYKRGVYK